MMNRELDEQISQTLSEVANETHADPQLVNRLIANARPARNRVATLRRRTTWIVPSLAVAAVVAVVIITIVLTTLSTAHHSAPPAYPSPTVTQIAPTSPAPPPARSATPTTAHTAPPSTTATSPRTPTTSTTPTVIQGGQQWSSPVVTITDHSLGAVSVGMTMTQAAHAAGFTSFTAIGDAVSIPTPWQGSARSAAGYPELYVSHWAGPSGAAQAFTCVGAFVGTSTAKQVITTPEGVRLGDPASRILAVYGSRAHYVPAPTSGGMDPRAGYVIAHNGYDLVFKLDTRGQQIVAIVGGLSPVTPSECVG